MLDDSYSPMDGFEEALIPQYEKYWEIKDDGTMVNIASPQKYTIEGERLTEENWLYPIFEKSGDYFNKEFFFAYMEALRRRGISQITIEHVLPQSLSKDWIDYLDGEEKSAKIHNTYLNCIDFSLFELIKQETSNELSFEVYKRK